MSAVALFLAALQLAFEPVEPRLPDGSIARRPFGQLAERLRPQRVQPAPALGPDSHEVGVLEDRQLARHSWLPDVDHRHELADRALARSEGFDDAPAGRVGEDLEHVGHGDILLERHMSRQQYFLWNLAQDPVLTVSLRRSGNASATFSASDAGFLPRR